MQRPPRETRDHQLTIRIPSRIRASLEAQATAEERTVSDVVNHMLRTRYPRPRSTGHRAVSK